MKNNNKGITLVALVITIIVLLILAGVTIASLSGDNGILTRGSQAKIDNAVGNARDIMNLAVNEGIAAFYGQTYANVNFAGEPTIAATQDDTIINYIDKALEKNNIAKTTTGKGLEVSYASPSKTYTIKYDNVAQYDLAISSGKATWTKK